MVIERVIDDNKNELLLRWFAKLEPEDHSRLNSYKDEVVRLWNQSPSEEIQMFVCCCISKLI